VNIYIWLNTG